jgi:mRNA interferase MazF
MVTQIFTLDKRDLGDWIGTLPRRRVHEILEGIHLVMEPRDLDE